MASLFEIIILIFFPAMVYKDESTYFPFERSSTNT